MTQKYDDDARLKEQISLLVDALESDSESVRNSAIVQISLFGSKAVPQLMNILGADLAEELRARKNNEAKNSYLELAICGILKSLGIISDPTPIDIIGKARPRREAIEALAKIGGTASLDMIMSSIIAPLDMLGNQKDGAMRNFVDADQISSASNDKFVRNVFNCLGEPGKLRLKEELASQDPRRRAAAASVARVMREKELIPELTAVLKGHDPWAKAEAAHALQELGATDTEPVLVKELFDTERMIEDLDLAQSREASDLVVYDQLRQVREVIERAVLELGDPNSLVEVGFHPVRRDTTKISVRPEFRKAIVKSGESAMPALTKILTAQDKSAQSSAAEIIAEIKKNETVDGDMNQSP